MCCVGLMSLLWLPARGHWLRIRSWWTAWLPRSKPTRDGLYVMTNSPSPQVIRFLNPVDVYSPERRGRCHRRSQVDLCTQRYIEDKAMAQGMKRNRGHLTLRSTWNNRPLPRSFHSSRQPTGFKAYGGFPKIGVPFLGSQ